GVSRDGGCCRLRAVFLFWSGCSDPRDLHSFPTRRSSDLTLGVLPEHVLANEFRFDEDGNIIGIDESNPLASDGGKIKALQSLGLDAEVYVIGDGYTDYELKESGLASRFYAFTENVKRDRVLAVADHVVASLDEFLYHNKLDRSQSYPTSLLKVLLLENVHPSAVK